MVEYLGDHRVVACVSPKAVGRSIIEIPRHSHACEKGRKRAGPGNPLIRVSS